jgi:dTDP-L-rhamnose 4-epimerase
MYEIARYSDVNIGGTAQLLDILANEEHCVSRIVVASSRSIYGEGQYHCSACGVVYPEARSSVAMKSGDFSVRCPRCGEPATLMPTSEDALIHPASLYGITKATQEQMITTLCPALGITPVALRLQNVYGPGQSLSNPYTGILSIFSTRIRNGSGLNVFEDGAESRDFVYVDDVVSAATGALERPEAIGGVFNIGSGVATTLLDVAHELVAAFGNVVPVAVSGQFRAGDIRHNVADISRARAVLGFSPRVSFASGIRRFVDWVQAQAPVADLYDRSISEMKAKGLIS